MDNADAVTSIYIFVPVVLRRQTTEKVSRRQWHQLLETGPTGPFPEPFGNNAQGRNSVNDYLNLIQ